MEKKNSVTQLADGGGGRGSGALAAGQAAHLTVLCARLVHEGAVEAGPHGRGGGGDRGAAHGPVIQRAGGLPAKGTCRMGGALLCC